MSRATEWVLLSYRLPRTPSTPRISVWRRLNRLGVAQLADGLVALPADARTREALEWVAEEVRDNAGEATVWLGHPVDADAHKAIVSRMTEALTKEYEAVLLEATSQRVTDAAARRRVLARLRRTLNRIDSRDFFSPPARDQALRAVEELAEQNSLTRL